MPKGYRKDGSKLGFQKGHIFTKEETNKIIITRKKNNSYKQSEATKKKISIANKGKHFSPSTEFKKRRKLTKEFKNKISLSLMGKNNPLFGKHHSQEAKIKMSLAKKGKPSHKKGKFLKNTPIQILIRSSNKSIQWRQKIFIRDNFTCQKCSKCGGILEAHHIKGFKKLLQEAKVLLPLFSLYDAAMLYSPLWDINNGQTLCKNCHKDYHKKKREYVGKK